MNNRQLLLLTSVGCLATTTQAVAAPPVMTREEARQLYAAGGFPIDAAGHALNRAGFAGGSNS